MSKARKAKRGREWAAKGYGSSPSPRLPLFLCSQMNFRQIPFSETQKQEKGQGVITPALHLDRLAATTYPDWDLALGPEGDWDRRHCRPDCTAGDHCRGAHTRKPC
jgi:hypothetical protein